MDTDNEKRNFYIGMYGAWEMRAMRAIHRGYEIEVRRELCLAGYSLLYFTIVRQSDGYFCVDRFEDSDETVRGKIAQLKALIDGELEEDDPWEEHSFCDSEVHLFDVSVVSHPLPEYEFREEGT